MKHFWLFCIVPPQLKVTIHFLNPDLKMGTFMDTAWYDFPVASWTAAVLWIALLGLATFYLIRQRLYRHPLIQCLGLVLAFNIGLHFLYGDDFLLFACNWLIFLLLLVFFTLEHSPLVRRYARQYQVGLAVFAVSLLAASGQLMYDLYHALLIQ